MATIESYDAIFNDTVAHVKRGGGAALGKNVARSLITALEQSRSGIEAEYERLRDETKEKFMQDNAEPLDRHKCAACFMIAVLRKLHIELIERNPATSKLIKEKIAIDVGLPILITMIKEDREKNSKLIAFLGRNNNRFVFPDTICDEAPYMQNWALGLYYDRLNEPERLSVLSLSNALFWIEAFNLERATKKQDGPDGKGSKAKNDPRLANIKQ